MVAPIDGTKLRYEAVAKVQLTWDAVRGATGYLLEVEQSVDGAWKPVIRKPVPGATILVDLVPSSPSGSEFRWRVRSVVGRKGGRAATWAHVRIG
jgi:hypothetical protein